VLRTSYSGANGKWYFSTDEKTYGQLLGFEISIERDEDPCEVIVLENSNAGGLVVPSKLQVKHGNGTFATFNEFSIKMDPAK
jgi:hypothetical protein